MIKQRWDIFCKIVDNFGDIGVCWRLAKQLQAEHDVQIRLWIDDLSAAQIIIPSLNVAESNQVCDGITILYWTKNADFSQAAEVVIEAFACELPPTYMAAMARQQSKWVNLEYLSAEPWVVDFHAKPSPQTQYNLTRYFYFPGFSETTGGLLRESDAYQSNQKPQLWNNTQDSALKVSLFCYPNAPIHDLFTALQANNRMVSVYVPATSILPKVASYFGNEKLEVGDTLSKNNLTVEVLPFLSQAAYDGLLRDCDINFVRGEDSWVRAIWAGKPFIWQPYFQDENTHIKKLNAFLALFYVNFDTKQAPCKVHECWSAGHMPKHVWTDYLKHLPAISSYTLLQSKQLAKQQDLAAKLVIFCNKL